MNNKEVPAFCVKNCPNKSGELRKKCREQSACNNVMFMFIDEARRTRMGEMQKAIDNFCDKSDWATDSWKQQPWIKALFDLRSKKGGANGRLRQGD